MRSHESAALAALYKSRSSHLPLSMLHISSRLAMLILRANRHGLHLLELAENIQDFGHLRIKCLAHAATVTVV